MGNDDRRVHVRTRDGREVVRYDRSGKWWIEFPGGERRFRLKLSDAVSWAFDPGVTVFFGVPGGGAFDAAVRRQRAAEVSQ